MYIVPSVGSRAMPDQNSLPGGVTVPINVDEAFVVSISYSPLSLPLMPYNTLSAPKSEAPRLATVVPTSVLFAGLVRSV